MQLLSVPGPKPCRVVYAPIEHWVGVRILNVQQIPCNKFTTQSKFEKNLFHDYILIITTEVR